MMWYQVEPQPGLQGLDGAAHLTYFDPIRLLSFVWNGNSDFVEVSHGGYGEPVMWMIEAPDTQGPAIEVLLAFQKYCMNHIYFWDEVYAQDYDYHQPNYEASVLESQLCWPEFREG